MCKSSLAGQDFQGFRNLGKPGEQTFWEILRNTILAVTGFIHVTKLIKPKI
jgi:hypothetical protein